MDTPATQRPPGRGRRRVLVATARIIILVYLGVLAALYALQTRMIFPGHAMQGDPETALRAGPGVEVLALEAADGTPIAALFGAALTPEGRPRGDAAARPTLLYFYGNGMCAAWSEAEMSAFRRRGLNVLVPDYLGYGASGGVPSEAGCEATAAAAYEHLKGRNDVDPSRIVVAGWSLGAAVAIDLATRRPVAGLVVLSGFTGAADMARRLVPLAPGFLLRHRFESLKKIRRVAVPTFVGHGREDSLIPFSMGERLADAAGGPVARHVVERGDHNEFFDRGGPPLFDAIGRFAEGASPVGRDELREHAVN